MAWASRRSSSGRYYAKGAAGRLNMDALKLRGDVTTYNVAPGRGAAVPAQLRPGFRADRERVVQRHQDARRPPRAGPELGRHRPGHRTSRPTWRSRATAAWARATSPPRRSPTRRRPARPRTSPSAPARARRHALPACPPETKAAGGLGSIAEQQADEQFDVVLGGGRARYQQPLEAGRHAQRHRLRDAGQGLQVRRDRGRAERRQLAGARPAPARPVPPQQHDDRVQRADRVRHGRRLADDQVHAGRPRHRADAQGDDRQGDLQLLQGNPKGFVLQVEGASIDKRDHSADACGQIGELVGMDDAIGSALAFQRTHPDTLVLVSADHSHTSQIIPVNQTPRGAYTTLQTVDGPPIRIAYGTAPVSGSQAHTGSTVPVFATGPRAADIVGTIDQTELFPVLTNTQAGDGPAHAGRHRRRRRRQRAGHARADDRPRGDVRAVPAGRREGLHGLDGRQRHLVGGQRDPERRRRRAAPPPATWSTASFTLPAAAAGEGAAAGRSRRSAAPPRRRR